MKTDSQISAYISPTTRELLERHVRATGMKKGQVVETALLYYLQALQELPADIVVHPRLVVTSRSGEEVLERMAAPRPTDALRELMKRNGDQISPRGGRPVSISVWGA